MPTLPILAPRLALAFGLGASLVNAIRFNISTPMQCEPLQVSWEDKSGDGDMRLLIMPAAEFSPQSIIRNITIPGSASSPYTVPSFEQPQGLEFVASLIDSSGYENTGVTELLTVGSNSGGNSGCLNTAPEPDFFFYTDSQAPGTVPQCGRVDVTWQNSYTLPASIVGLIPGGEIFTVHEITGPDQGGGQGAAGNGYSWEVNVREGTRFILYMPHNGPVGSGGSTPIFTVGAGGSGCISDSSPSSLAPGAAEPTISGVGGGGGRPDSNSGSGSGSSSSGSGSNTGAIVGGAVGGVAFVVLALIVLFVFLRKRARQVKDPQHPRNKLIGSYATSKDGHAGTGAMIGGAAMTEDGRDRRKSSVVDLLAGEKPGQASHANGNGMATAGQIERQDSDETFEPSPYFSGAPTGTAGTRSSFPRTSDEIQSAGRSNGQQNRYSRESGMLAPMDFGTGAGLGMASLGSAHERHQRTTSETTYQPGSEAGATLSHSGATVSPRQPEVSGETAANAGSMGRSNSTRKRRPLQAQNGDDVPAPPPTRFVLHQDAGVIDGAEATRPDDRGLVEMPPRYDQLRSGPPQ